jgi:mannose-6-phosphate isomerase-like protein (cupin superfamily)
MPFQSNIITTTKKNDQFRTVVFTGARSQLVVMDIPPGGEVGEETHAHVEQTLFFHVGTGKAILNGAETAVGPGDVVVVTPGVKHNFINTGPDSLKIYTIYAPPNHIDGRIHATKAIADADVDDEAFGEAVR